PSVPRLHRLVLEHIVDGLAAEEGALAICHDGAWTVAARHGRATAPSLDEARHGRATAPSPDDAGVLERIEAATANPTAAARPGEQLALPKFSKLVRGALWLGLSPFAGSPDSPSRHSIQAIASEVALVLENSRLFEAVLEHQ